MIRRLRLRIYMFFAERRVRKIFKKRATCSMCRGWEE